MHVNNNRKFDVKKWLRKKGVLSSEYVETLRESLEELIQEAIKEDRESKERNLIHQYDNYLGIEYYRRIFRGTCPLCDADIKSKKLNKEEYIYCPKCPYILKETDATYEYTPAIDHGNPFGGPG